MIFDTLAAAERYFPLHPGFPAAFAHLRTILHNVPSAGRHELEGKQLYASVDRSLGRGREGAKLEVHRRYLDIQVCLAGQETIGWRPLAECATPEAPFDPTRDIQFFRDPSQSWFDLAPGLFAIFSPDDAHAPLAGAGEVLKIVMKVAVDWDSQ